MPTLILIDGEEEFLKEQAALEEAQSRLVPVSTYHLPDGLSSYLDDSQMDVPGARSFIVYGAKDVPALPAGKDDLLVVVAEGKKKLEHPSAKRVLSFQKLKSFDDNNEVVKWIVREGEKLNIDLSRVAGALFVNCGEGLRKLSSEIRKLTVLTPPGGTVTPEVARSILCFSADLRPSSIVTAVCEGNPVKALALYDKLQEIGDETGWILAYMQRHVVQQLRMLALESSDLPADRRAAIVGIHPFLYRKASTKEKLGLWSQKSLLASLRTLCDLELAHKRGDVSARVGLESEIVRLSEEARNVRR